MQLFKLTKQRRSFDIPFCYPRYCTFACIPVSPRLWLVIPPDFECIPEVTQSAVTNTTCDPTVIHISWIFEKSYSPLRYHLFWPTSPLPLPFYATTVVRPSVYLAKLVMRFNAKELCYLGVQSCERFEHEGMLFIREKQVWNKCNYLKYQWANLFFNIMFNKVS